MCEGAYFSGNIGAIIATIVVVPETIVDKIVGLGFKAALKLTGTTMKAAGKVLSYFTPSNIKILELGENYLKVKWKGKDVEIRNAEDIDLVSNSLDNNPIDFDDNGILTSDPVLSSKLDELASGAGDLLNAFKYGYSQESILALPKGIRPSPSVYLKVEYITSHLAKFDNGASYLVPKSALDNYGRALIGRPDGQFVMSRLDMDNLLAKANGDLTIIETELGIPAGLWKNKDLVRIDIPNPKQLNARIPSGNEGGANELWLPGGKLPKGYSEAVINQIPQNSYTETLTNIK